MASVLRLTRPVRRRLVRTVQRSRDAGLARRAQAVLFLDEGLSVAETARRVRAARSTVYRWIHWYECGGEQALGYAPSGRKASTVSPGLERLVGRAVLTPPTELGFLRSTWTSEMLARLVREMLGVAVHSSTIRRLLPRLGFGWRRARPTLKIRDPAKTEKLAAITDALGRRSADTEVFFVDEVDIDLNPKIGFLWTPRGRQAAIPTPGQNQKRYIAGALHAHTGRLVYVEHARKNSGLFIALLEALRRAYRRARRIVLVLDNYIIHKSRETRRFLRRNPKFELLFQPVYHPWVNRIERLWKQLHDTVTRNHTWLTMEALMNAVRRFLEAAQPFPGAAHGVASFGSAI